MSGECDNPGCEICRELYYSVPESDEPVVLSRVGCPFCPEKDARIAGLDAENIALEGRLHSSADWLRAQTAEAALAERDRMLAAIDIHDLNGEQSGGAPTVPEFLAYLRSRIRGMKP